MSAKRLKALLTNSGEWAKHLRPIGKKIFWGSERAAVRSDIHSTVALNDSGYDEPEQEKEPAELYRYGDFIISKDTVFVAERIYDYEGSIILGIFSSLEPAEEICKNDYTEYQFGKRMNGDSHCVSQYKMNDTSGKPIAVYNFTGWLYYE